jgi:hypothetical protein
MKLEINEEEIAYITIEMIKIDSDFDIGIFF